MFLLKVLTTIFITSDTCQIKCLEHVWCCDWITQYLLLHYLASRSRFFSLLSTRASALWCCRLARPASSLAWLVGNYCPFILKFDLLLVSLITLQLFISKCYFIYSIQNIYIYTALLTIESSKKLVDLLVPYCCINVTVCWKCFLLALLKRNYLLSLLSVPYL